MTGNVVRAARALVRVPTLRAHGAIDGPLEAAPGRTTVYGWAYRRRDPVVGVIVLVDGQVAGLAAPGDPRPDVAVTRHGGGHSGWSAQVDLHGHEGPTVAFGALAVLRSGLTEPLHQLVATVTARRHVGAITRPPNGATVSAGVVPIEGWALPPAPVARIDVRVDGEDAGLARPLAGPTPDVADSHRAAAAPLAGFSHVVDLSGREPGQRVAIDAEIEALDGTVSAVETREVVVGPSFESSTVTPRVTEVRRRIADAVRTARDPGDGLHLAVFTHQLDLGGAQLYMHELLRHLLIELDVSCLVVSQTDGVLRRALEDLGAFVHVTGRPPNKSPLEYEEMLLDLAQVITAHGCNAAFVNTVSAAAGADLARRLELPTVWAIHESYPLPEFFFAAYGEYGIHPYVRRQHTVALREAAVLVFEADATRRLYEPYADPRRLVTVPYGIPLEEIDEYRAACNRPALRRSHGFDDETVVVLCMGTYEPRKAQGSIALAFAELAEAFPKSVLVLVGDTGNPYAQAVREVVTRLGLSGRIRLLPVVEDAYAWYAMADTFVTMSDVESLPRSLLEVMAFGVPVVAASVFGIPELVEDGVTGLLCAPRDVEATIQGLRRLLGATPEERKGLGAGGRDRVQGHHDSSGYAAAYRKILRGLVDDAGALPGQLLHQ